MYMYHNTTGNYQQYIYELVKQQKFNDSTRGFKRTY